MCLLKGKGIKTEKEHHIQLTASLPTSRKMYLMQTFESL